MKKIISIILCISLIFVFLIPSFAITPYSSITEDSSQAKILIEAMINDDAFDIFSSWFCYRSSELEYIIYFNINEDENSASTYRYYGIASGYNTQWYLERNDVTSIPNVNTNTYTIVGNLTYTLGSQLYRNYVIQIITKYCLIFISFLIAFFVFRVKRRIV